MQSVTIRDARSEDLDEAAQLIIRMKRLNEEFDPLFKVVGDVEKRALNYLRESASSKNTVLIVASSGKRVLGLLRAEIDDRIFYEPLMTGTITDLYILPEARRKTLGNDLLQHGIKKLKQMGAEMITAEFPAQNEIAVRFYHKRGFRALVNILAKEEKAQ
jgi:ribosomal protein S18 acetylase RimI-like enzyme